MSSIEGYRPSAAEISYNLSIMKGTVAKGRAVDPQFLDIFREAVGHLPGPEQKPLNNEINTIGTNLNALLLKVDDTTKRTLFHPEERPLVGKQSKLGKMADEYGQQSELGANLRAIGNNFRCQRIRGDGHCQFRAISTGLLLACQNLSSEEKVQKIASIDRQIQALGPQASQRLNAQKVALFDAITNINPQNAQALVSNKQSSDDIVAFLRVLSVEYTRVKQGETFDQMAEAEGCTPDQYYANMTNMNLAREGGEAELQALAMTLGIPIYVHDSTIYAAGSEDHIREYNSASDEPIVDLLYRPGHFDLLIEKQHNDYLVV